mmetsp:Transcript_27926/g.47176  ORF Transcript_27926/g.47176 Transcript_27926/m.47176 type:complete len:108 (+) Transcript_27926:752-1075(+)
MAEEEVTQPLLPPAATQRPTLSICAALMVQALQLVKPIIDGATSGDATPRKVTAAIVCALSNEYVSECEGSKKEVVTHDVINYKLCISHTYVVCILLFLYFVVRQLY